MIHSYFISKLKHTLHIGQNNLPISAGDLGQLIALIPLQEKMLLVLRGCNKYEQIEIENYNGLDIYITRRGLGGSREQEFCPGDLVQYEITTEVVKDIVCNYDCCGDVPCPKEPVSVAGSLVTDGKVGEPWHGTVIYKGDLPIIFATAPLPAWMSYTTGPNFIEFSGTPTEAGDITLSVSAADTLGHLIVQQVSLGIQPAEDPGD
jgi:hypothetical protein